MSVSKVHGECSGISTTYDQSLISIGSICELEGKVFLHMMQTDLSKFQPPDQFSKMFILDFELDRKYDEVRMIKYYRDD